MRRASRHVLFALVLAGLIVAFPVAEPAIPTPQSVIGFVPCSDFKLATYGQIADYFRRLAGASDRIQIFEIGETAEGRTQLMAIISSAQNLQQLERYRQIARSLALARDLTDDQAEALAAEGKAVVWIDFGLHSTEVAHAQTAPLVAHLAVTDESEEMQRIRDDVIFILIPNMNPDGTTLVAEWYMDQLGTPFEKSSPPELYQKYVGHDNNRDWFMFNMPESRNIARQLYQEWFPQIVYNQHQSAPFPARIFVPPFEDPMNPNIPPLVMRGISLVGNAITRRLEQEGKSGAISRLSYDTWWNGGMRTAPYYHNMIGILTETAHPSATPSTYDPERFPDTFANGVPTLEPTTYYPSPYRGGAWHLRDSCDYMISSSLAVLQIGARERRTWLYNIYQMGRDAIRKGADETYVVPADQWDPGTARKLIAALQRGGLEVKQATGPVSADGRRFAAGSFVIDAAQAFRPHLVDLMNPQRYPNQRLYPGGPPDRPYDITGWTLPYQMGVRVDRVGAVEGPVEVLTGPPATRGSLPAPPRHAYALDARANDAFTAVNRLLEAGDAVYRSTAAVRVEGEEWPPGTFLVVPGSETRSRLQGIARSLGVHVRALDAAPIDDALRIDAPRLGLYHRYGGDIDEGWTRWVLEQFEFRYDSLYDRDVRAGNLRARHDVIVLPDASYQTMLTGLPPGTMPDEYTGGMTPTGLANLYDFVTEGGVLVAMDTAAELPLTTFGLPIRDVTENQRETDFYIPGTLLEIELDPTHPVAYGMPSEAAAFFAHSPAFEVGYPSSQRGSGRDDERPGVSGVDVVGSYPAEDLLMSGWLLGEEVIATHAAVVQARVGAGSVVLLGFRVQHRGQAHGTYKLLMNTILLGSAEPAPLPPIHPW